ncbi:hypothetical protein LTR94_023674 [Friedmanniomyces endolithicus]|nr:hypothetical protein LTR94_023674 [Friedmanniomyces endolithicus]
MDPTPSNPTALSLGKGRQAAKRRRIVIRVVARDPNKLSARLRERVEVVAGSHGDPEVIGRALDGADALFWLCPPNPQSSSVRAAYVDFARPAAEAMARSPGLQVVCVSALGRGTELAQDAGYVSGSLEMDDLIAATGVRFRALAMPSFMDNLKRQALPVARQGLFFSPIDGNARMPFIATSDVAAVSARLLLDPNWAGRAEMALVSAKAMTFNRMATVMAQVLQRPVRFQKIGFDTYRQSLIDHGMSQAMAQGMVDMAQAKAAGLDRIDGRTDVVFAPTSFEVWCRTDFAPVISRLN